MITPNEAAWQDWPEDDDYRECCKRAAVIVYRYSIVQVHCYEGTRDTWENAAWQCNESSRMFGEYID